MTEEIPPPLRAAAGLAAALLEQAMQLPATLSGLPVKAAGLAMQASLRMQQEYAGLVVKGDELLSQIGRSDDTTPAWATFDDDMIDVADAISEQVGVDVVAIGDASTAVSTASRPASSRPRKTPSTAKLGHVPSAFDRASELPPVSAPAAPLAPVPGYDDFTLAQLRARLRTFDTATLLSLLAYERAHRARTTYLTMLENRHNRSRGHS